MGKGGTYEVKQEGLRNQTILRYNVAGIVMNAVLSLAKLILGLTIHSRAVVLDALNGFSDTVSSLLSMFSVLFSSRGCDREHPFGYGRLEYITSLLSTLLILGLSLHAVVSAVRELIQQNAAVPNYNLAIELLMLISLAAKLIYGFLVRRTGKRIHSVALMISGTESLGDSVVSAAILASIAVYRMTGLNIEPWLSILISLFLMKTCCDLIRVCVSKLLGTKAAPEFYTNIKKLIVQEPEVLNVFNLVIHNYGEEQAVGSVDIEVDETMTAVETTKLVRRIMRNSSLKGVRISSIGVYGSSIRDPEAAEMWDRILPVIRSRPECIRAYAFCYDAGERVASFDVVVEPSIRNKERVIQSLRSELEALFPGTGFYIQTALDV